LDWATDGETHPIGEPAWEWLIANRPATSEDGLSWGDSRIGNMLFGPDFTVQAIVDWEQLSLGGPMMDLGWWLFLDRFHSDGNGLPRLPGLGTRQETIDSYERLSGRAAKDLDWYEVLAGLRFTIVMKRLSVIMQDWGVVDRDANMGVDNPVTRLTAELIGIKGPWAE
jgi:aminoglycoside phosphotransferase (APT) family kinase protein